MNFFSGLISRYSNFKSGGQKIFANLLWLFIDKIIKALGVFVMIWIARYLGPDQFGKLSFVMAFIGIFGCITGLGMQSVVVRDIVSDKSSKEEILGTTAVLYFFSGLFTYSIILISIFFFRPDDFLIKTLVAILGSTVLFKAHEITVYWLESQLRSKYTVIVQNSVLLIFAVIKLVLIYNNISLTALTWVIFAEAFVVAISLSILLGFVGPKLWKLCFNFERAIKLFKDSWPLLLSAISITIYMKIDQIMIGQMIGDKNVGIYAAAVRISEIWHFIPMIIVTTMFPVLVKIKKDNEQLYYQFLQNLFDVMTWISIGLALPMSFFSTSIVVLIFGESYAASGPVLTIHIWSSIFVFFGVVSSQWFIIENRQILYFYRTISGVFLNIFLNFLFIPDFGIIGSAVATIISFALSALFMDLVFVETRQIFYYKVSSLNIFASIKRIKLLRKYIFV